MQNGDGVGPSSPALPSNPSIDDPVSPGLSLSRPASPVDPTQPVTNGHHSPSSGSPPRRNVVASRSRSSSHKAEANPNAVSDSANSKLMTRKRSAAVLVKRETSHSPEPPLKRQRPVSPPWKKVAAEGPTSVVVDGRRQSTRTSGAALPATSPFKTPGNKRTTRGSADQTTPSNARTASISRSAPNGRYSTGTIGPRNSSTARARPEASSSSRHTYETRTPGRPRPSAPESTSQPSASRRRASHGAPSHQPESPATTSRSGRVSRPPPRYSTGSQPAPSTAIMPPPSLGVAPSTASSAAPSASPSRPSGLRLRLRNEPPPLPNVHPLARARPKFASFAEWWAQDNPFEGEDLEESKVLDKVAQEDARIAGIILEASKPGGQLSEGKCERAQPPPAEEPPPIYGRLDHFIAHASNFRMLLDREHKRHVQLAKKIAREAVRVYNARRPQSKEERDLELYKMQQKRHKQLIKDMEKTWSLVTAEVNKRRMARYQEQQHAEAEQAMDQMLDHSTQLLQQRTHQAESTLVSDADDSEGSVDGDWSAVDQDDVGFGAQHAQSSGDEEESDANTPANDENMTSSDESESEAGVGADEDANLTVEELRNKYGQASAASSVASSQTHSRRASISPQVVGDEPEQAEAAEDANKNDDMGNHKMPDEGFDPAEVKLEEVDDILMDGSDESTDMDSGTELSSEEDGSEEFESDVEEDDNPMLGFFGRGSFAGKPEDQPDDDVEFSPEPQEADFDILEENTKSQTPTADAVVNKGLRLASPVPETSGVSAETSTPRDVSSAADHSDTRRSSVATSPRNTPAPNEPVPIKTIVPSLLRGTLREYQHHGLDWLAGLYAAKTNGILADEMGLGKTIQTIALLAHLAIEHEKWGPHLIVVPASVLLNWEVEFKKWCPGFKLLVYYGSEARRKELRRGWQSESAFNVCITSYDLVLRDQNSFRNRKWHYLILDEAHNIKNSQTQRWQTLLRFNTHSRLLLTGTPLQNNVSELWSLLFFIQPANEEGSGFGELEKFQSALRRPANQIMDQGRQKLDAEAQAVVHRLHSVLRPYLLRRLKRDVEKQMPGKYEHVIYCRLSKRQRQLYDEFMSRADTKQTLASGNYMTIIHVLMSLRKVCNHPDLFEPRQIVTSFSMPKSAVAAFETKELLVRRRFLAEQDGRVNLDVLNLLPVNHEGTSKIISKRTRELAATKVMEDLIKQNDDVQLGDYDLADPRSLQESQARQEHISALDHLRTCVRLNRQRVAKEPVYGRGLVDKVDFRLEDRVISQAPARRRGMMDWYFGRSDAITELIPTLPERAEKMMSVVQKFSCITPTVAASDIAPMALTEKGMEMVRATDPVHTDDPYHEARTRLSIAFPDKRLLQYDCGKLQALERLLRQLSAGGHRCLIFTQMTKVLDILEQFLNIHGHKYLRLDGATKIEQRQALTERFNKDDRILCFILSSRSGGLGINLTGADTVIFYDLDWNPAMDAQCQDRCHRIGQTRDVHIYRLVSEHTIEANILRKSNQKRLLDEFIIQKGEFTTTEFFNRGVSYHDAFDEADAQAKAAEDVDAADAMDRVLGGGPLATAPVEAESEDKNGDTAGAPNPSKTQPGLSQAQLGTAFASVEDEADRNAARAAGKELVLTDAGDFKDAKTGDFTSAGPASPQATAGNDDAADRDPDAKEHVDEYMLRFVEWALQAVPLGPPTKKRPSKKAGEKRIRRR